MIVLLDGSKARRFAESSWGRGGTTSYRTNRIGAYYYSCSGHGGYVVDKNALSEEEYKNVSQYVSPEKCLVVVNGDGKVTFFQNPYKTKSSRYYVYENYQKINHEIFFFEEDCDWAILEHFTNIRAKNDNISEERRKKLAEETFIRYHLNK